MNEDKIKVLLVEDVQVAQVAAKSTLEQLNCVVDIAANGEQALKMAQEKEYQIIFMDLELPDIDGINVASQIRKSKGKNSNVPIVALTAHIENDYKDRCKEAGINDFMDKPLSSFFAQEIIEDLVLQD